MRIIIAFVLAFSASFVFAGVDTIHVFSPSMQKNIKTVVITPKNYKKSKARFPVVYLLHGYGGSYSNWVKLVPGMEDMANENNLIIVCPDGAKGSWYFDSPVDPAYRYETFVATELVQHIDSSYKTVANRNGRAITGLSMGGHGGLFLGFRHKDMFSACGSMSGALDVSKIKTGYELNKRLGDTITNAKFYTDWSVMTVMESISDKDSLGIIIDCGTEDFIYMMSKNAHDKLRKLQIPHDYTERPGAHNWQYWGNAVKYQLLYFREWFRKRK